MLDVTENHAVRTQGYRRALCGAGAGAMWDAVDEGQNRGYRRPKKGRSLEPTTSANN